MGERRSAAGGPVFLMAAPRSDWRVHGRANAFSARAAPPAQPGRAQEEWRCVADAIVAAGGTVVTVPPPTDDATLTGLPYTAEAGHLGADREGPLFLLARVTPPHRQGERAHVARTIDALGLRSRATLACFEGQGDVIDVSASAAPARFAFTVGTGVAARTEAAAYEEVAPLLGGPSICIRFHAQPWFHGNTFLAGLRGPRGAALMVCPDALFDGELQRLTAFADGLDVIKIDAAASLQYATNALVVNDVVLAPQDVPKRLIDVWRGLGLQVERLVLPELFGRGGGAAVCLTCRLIGLDPQNVPAAMVYTPGAV